MRRFLRTTAIAALAFGMAAPLAAQEIGSVAAVNRDITGTPPGATTRALLLGDRVIANERLVSSALGSGQMLFLDQTSLTVSPNSEIVLDKYIYDPATERGEIGITVTRGVMRMIGGRITKTADATVGTPTATIGIRGGIGLISVSGETTQVMHVAGEYTTISGPGGSLTLNRPNAFAQIGPGGEPEYLGVATEADIAGFYNQMQGGGGGSDEPVESGAVEEAGLSSVNSEAPDTVVSDPISTAGERPAEDNAPEVEQLTIVSNPEVVPPVVDPVDPEPPVANPFANFIGGGFVAEQEGFTDDDGVFVPDAVAANLVLADGGALATSFTPGSIIIEFIDDEGFVDRVRLNTPDQSGLFRINPNQSQGPDGQRIEGGGFANFESGFLAYWVKDPANGDRGFLFGAEPGPTQLRTLNQNNANFRATAFNVLPDLNISDPGTAVPFLPAGLGEVFDNGSQAQIFLVQRPNQPLFGQGSGPGSSRGNRWLQPMFRLSGTGANQNFLMYVGATGVLNNGAGAPDMTSFARGAFRLGGEGAAQRIQPFAGTLSVPNNVNQTGGRTVFGKTDDYLVLTNTSVYALSNTPEDAVVASFFQNFLQGGGQDTSFGNVHLAERAGSQTFAPNARISVGTTPAEFVGTTGFAGAGQFAANDQRFLSFGYGAGAAFLRSGGGDEKFLLRTSAEGSNGGVTGQFGLNAPTGAVSIGLDETTGSSIFGALLNFGGERSAVIDSARFGMREHNNPGQLAGVLFADFNTGNQIDTEDGQLSGRPPNQNGEAAFRGALLSHGLADARTIYPANTPLTPQFLTWGWWTGQFRFADNDPNEFQNARLQFSLGTWVAGDRTDVLPTSGQATFNGPVTVSALNQNGADFVDGGRFRLDWDFGQRNGQAGFQNVLNLPDFQVPVDDLSGRRGANDYGGDTVISAADPINVRVDGSFFDGPNANDARATAGSLRIDNTSGSITARGTFWGER